MAGACWINMRLPAMKGLESKSAHRRSAARAPQNGRDWLTNARSLSLYACSNYPQRYRCVSSFEELPLAFKRLLQHSISSASHQLNFSVPIWRELQSCLLAGFANLCSVTLLLTLG